MSATSMTPQDSIRASALAIVLISPDESRRRALARSLQGQHAAVMREFSAYPNIAHLSKVTDMDCDVVVIDLDADPEVALDLVESTCSQNPALTVMAYSSNGEPDLLVRCMRAGAREFLTDPLSAPVLAEALIRASARRLETDRRKKVSGKMLVFVGAKGGTGVTTLASNFAIALQKESGREVVVVDLDVQLGDVSLVLGLNPKFTVVDALENGHRLDAEFVSSLLTQHSTGVAVLAASDSYHPYSSLDDSSLGKLLYILRDQYPYVVVDAGSSLSRAGDLLLELADSVYVVTQVDVPSLRNANRLIAHMDRTGESHRRVEVVLNRFDPRRVEIDEERIAKALARPLQWKVPNDFVSARRSQNTGVPLALEDSPVSRALHHMARAACGKSSDTEKKKRFGLF
ncbi:MAG TPA: AAA family ATPase [Terriglobales bacterium]|nr:AAA family ATPase [Terriglobales bacterium]